jgi:hypothetical protein
MREPKISANATKPTMERDQGHIKGSGINKGMVKGEIPQVIAHNTYGRPTQTQKM